MRKLLARLTPKRSWLQFRLRTFLLLVALLALWLGVLTDRAHRQARALRALGNSALFVVFDYQLPGYGPWTEEQYGVTVVLLNADASPEFDLQPPGPAWLRRLIGDDYFRTVVGVGHLTHETIPYVRDLPQLGGFVNLDPNVRDEDLLLLAQTTKIQGLRLCFNRNALTDTGLQNLRAMTSLEQLKLSGQVSGVGLAALRELPKLREVMLGRPATAAGLEQAVALPGLEELALCECSAIRDEDLALLAGARRLKRLALCEIPITDAGLAQLRALPQLECLALENLSITDAGLECLEHLPQLQQLRISGPQFAEAGLQHLTNLPALQGLSLEGFPLTAAGLERLASLKQLRQLDLGKTLVPPAGIQRLQQALPKTTVHVIP